MKYEDYKKAENLLAEQLHIEEIIKSYKWQMKHYGNIFVYNVNADGGNSPASISERASLWVITALEDYVKELIQEIEEI